MATEFKVYCKVIRILEYGTYEISYRRKNAKGVIEEHFRLVEEN